jgi:thiamine-phosphate pyrophosphorylase
VAADAPGRLYLVTPPEADPEALAGTAEALLASGAVACLRIALASEDEADWVRAANHLMPVAHAAEVPVVVTDRVALVAGLGLDGVHLSPGSPPIASVRRTLGRDRIIGAHGGTTRHASMTLAEAGADYVSIGPLHAPGDTAPDALFEWWAEMIETPCVAEGGVTPEDAARLSEIADFVVPDPAIWAAPDPAAALARYADALG